MKALFIITDDAVTNRAALSEIEAIPRVGEDVLIRGELFEVIGVCHVLDEREPHVRIRIDPAGTEASAPNEIEGAPA